MSEGQPEDTSWSDIRLDELVRNLEESKDAGERRRTYFRNKLDHLKERQELLQQRRLDRLSDEGIVIDMETVRTKVRESRTALTRGRKDGSEIGEDLNGSVEDWDDYDHDIDIGPHSRGTKSLIHMDSTASLNRQSRLDKIQEEIEGLSVRRKPDKSKSLHSAIQRTETKLSVVKSFQIPTQHDQQGGFQDNTHRKSSANRKLNNVNNVVKAVSAFRSSGGLSPRTWRGSGKQNYKYPGMNVEGRSRPNSGSVSPGMPSMSRESKARHLFSYTGYNKK